MKLQASCKPVVSLFEASFSSLLPGSRAGHECGPTAQRGRVPKRPVLRYRQGKSRRSYMDSTRFGNRSVRAVERVTPCAPSRPAIIRRARSDAPYPPSLRHCPSAALHSCFSAANGLIIVFTEKRVNHAHGCHAKLYLGLRLPMKIVTTWQRLNIAFWLLILLLLAGVGLAFWVVNTRAAGVHNSDELAATKDRIAYDVVLLSDTVRGLLLDPKNEAEKRRKDHVERDLADQLKLIRTKSVNDADLMRSVNNLSDFTSRAVGDFHHQVLDMAETDSASAVMLYVKDYPNIREKRTKLFADLTIEIERVQNAEAARGAKLAWVGFAPFLIIILAIPIVGRVHSSTVAEPLNRLVAALERMRQGDFTERLALRRRDEFGVLGNGLNRLADDLSELVGQVQRSGIQVNTTATEIAATAREQQTTAHEIAATTAEIGATSKQISATSKELVKTMNEVTQVAEQTADLAGSGHAALTRMETTMRQITEASGCITAKLSVLSEKTTNINSVVRCLTKVD